MSKKIYIVLVLFLGLLLIYKLFFYVDIQNSCFIKIYPSFLELSNANIKRAIKILKQGSIEDYNDLCTNVTTINPNLGCGGFDGGCYYQNQHHTIYVSTHQRDVLWSVGVIVHETCHVMQAEQNKPLNETECYTADTRITQKLATY
ncbi:hypothetical protein COV24_04655 [candidate division WWE3 bacterium CG10_big_fil_rev_8_21_14_0_10_32_10]|uniref:WLM domain-containing protein n=1 Tax=candidate division WWE3 bacterium CG10_big_fil_rev_8_21_14_0_10_32_10 TaxID=1975090 RepID=A0A2H0R994_UNCKA|nr:MAG: hypothetical protein COV24_04655 [candidate division WWE3 bacterium CG10_big_fil_rev_8_21_14_0_10_32_10]